MRRLKRAHRRRSNTSMATGSMAPRISLPGWTPGIRRRGCSVFSPVGGGRDPPRQLWQLGRPGGSARHGERRPLHEFHAARPFCAMGEGFTEEDSRILVSRPSHGKAEASDAVDAAPETTIAVDDLQCEADRQCPGVPYPGESMIRAGRFCNFQIALRRFPESTCLIKPVVGELGRS